MRFLIALALVSSPALVAEEGHGHARGASATAHAQVQVNIMAPVVLEATQDMSFGTVLMDEYGHGGKVTMNTNSGDHERSAVSQYKYDDCAPWGDSNLKPAIFSYRKDSRYRVNVSLDREVDMKYGVKLTPSVQEASEDRGHFSRLPENVEAKTFAVGGVLNISNEATYGVHSGTINVTVSYQ